MHYPPLLLSCAVPLFTVLFLLATSATARTPIIEPCRAQTPEQKDAVNALKQLSRLVKGLKDDVDPAPQRAALEKLVKMECFRLAREEERQLPQFKTTLSTIHWWHYGGWQWLNSYLMPTRTAIQRKGKSVFRPLVYLPPRERKELTAWGSPNHALLPLMCPANDKRCGQQTKGWLGRAHRAFEGYALKNAASRAKNSPHNSRGQVLKNCEQKALKQPAGERYLGWRQCIASVHQRRVALPLGKFRAPSEGWLVMRGRRGHHSFCDEVRAYDLKTGAAYIVQSCSGLALRPSGRVNAKLTNAARKSRTLMGKLPVSNLREAALMTFLASEAEQDIQAEPDAVALPPGISQKVTPTNNRGLGFIGSHGWFSSAQTSLAWSWIRRGKVQAEGALTWPHSSDAAQDYAVKLLKIAEVAMTPGCPPARLPPNLPVGSKTSGVSSLDANPRSRGRLEIELVGQLRALEKNPRCGKPTH